MSRRRPVVGRVLLVVLALWTSSCSHNDGGKKPAAADRPGPAKRPNIVFVLTDDLDLGEMSRMPKVKALLADHGVTFANYFVSVSLCCPSRATTLRGQYSHNDGVKTNGGTNGGFETAHALGIEKSTVATWLHGAGYRTALIGKYLNGYPNTAGPTYVPPGWDDWHSASSGGKPYGEFDYRLNENGKLTRYGHATHDYGTDVYFKKATDFITASAKAAQPFFVYLALYAPHQPATPAPRDAGLFPGASAPRTPSFNEADVSDKPAWVRALPVMDETTQRGIDALYRKRIQSLQAVDDGIGALVDTLRRTRKLDDTYIVFTSDNGFHLGQHRLPAGKQTAYDTDIRLPLVVRGPGVPEATTVSRIVGNVDLAPTFADLAGSSMPRFVDGRSFAPLLHHPAAVKSWRDAYLVEHWTQTAGPAVRGTASLEPPDPDQARRTAARQRRRSAAKARRKGRVAQIPEFHGIRTSRYLYVEYVTGERELYDVGRDPDEIDNIVAAADPRLVSRLHEQLRRLETCRADGCRAAE